MATTSSIEPLPCPWCGAIPEVRRARNNDAAWCVVCQNLGKPLTGDGACVIRPQTAWYLPAEGFDGRTIAITVWNHRPPVNDQMFNEFIHFCMEHGMHLRSHKEFMERVHALRVDLGMPE